MAEDCLLKSNHSLFNNGSPTYLHPATASSSAIDLSITHPALYLDFCWQTDSDLQGSDHYPILSTTDTPSPYFSKPTWKLHKADWAAFSHRAALELCTDIICSAEDPVQQFTDVVINTANNSIPKTKPNTKKHNIIWCNEDCKAAIKTRNNSLKRVEKHLTQQNIENYRRVIKTSKRHSWQIYVSKINSRTLIKKVWSMVRKNFKKITFLQYLTPKHKQYRNNRNTRYCQLSWPHLLK